MANNKFYEKKSPKQRFLLIIGIFFFLAYLFLGLAVIFWEGLPLEMEMKYRVALGSVMILYAIVRFFRIIKPEPTEEE